jgi:two-component system nitrate/nitrite response regulator NarL
MSEVRIGTFRRAIVFLLHGMLATLPPKELLTVPATNGCIRLLLADDHPYFTYGLAEWFADQSDLVLVGTAKNGHDALDLILSEVPDVAVIDLHMPGRTGLDVLRTVKSVGVRTRIIILTGSDKKDSLSAAITAGASGYLTKSAEWTDVVDAIRRVASGEVVVAPEMASLLGDILRDAQEAQPVELSDGECQVLSMLADDVKTKDVAIRLGFSERHVRRLLASAQEKLGVTSSEKMKAISEARRRGFIS